MTATVHDFPFAEEEARLAALRRYDILDTPPDGAFDRITALAARLFDVPISIISLVDHDRIWFKSHHGVEMNEVGRDPGLCASAILQDGPWLLTDAATDPRALANPLVAGDFDLRFYLGVPLTTYDGYNLGTLCVIGREPRQPDGRQVELLQQLAGIVMDEMELRLSARTTVAHLEQALAEKELMSKEVEHRVMNSLQLVASMLMLQSRNAVGDAAEQLALASNRVAAVGRIHQHLFEKGSFDGTGVQQYLRRVCADLSRLLLQDGAMIAVEGDNVMIGTEKIVSLGLITSELVTNAAKHGAKQIMVSLRREDGQTCSFSVSDDGSGLPPSFDPGASRGLGMKVVTSLLTRLGGTLHHENRDDGPGARFTIRFEIR